MKVPAKQIHISIMPNDGIAIVAPRQPHFEKRSSLARKGSLSSKLSKKARLMRTPRKVVNEVGPPLTKPKVRPHRSSGRGVMIRRKRKLRSRDRGRHRSVRRKRKNAKHLSTRDESPDADPVIARGFDSTPLLRIPARARPSKARLVVSGHLPSSRAPA